VLLVIKQFARANIVIFITMAVLGLAGTLIVLKRMDLGQLVLRWPSRLVATAEEERLNLHCAFTRPSVQFSKGHTGLFSGQVVRDPSS
jgi:hypothetical protein